MHEAAHSNDAQNEHKYFVQQKHLQYHLDVSLELQMTKFRAIES